jgi:uncharacterized coiled-coil DUF342 family protein
LGFARPLENNGHQKTIGFLEKPENTFTNVSTRRKQLRAGDRDQVMMYLKHLQPNRRAAALAEKFQKTQTLSKKEMKILAAMFMALTEKRRVA